MHSLSHSSTVHFLGWRLGSSSGFDGSCHGSSFSPTFLGSEWSGKINRSSQCCHFISSKYSEIISTSGNNFRFAEVPRKIPDFSKIPGKISKYARVECRRFVEFDQKVPKFDQINGQTGGKLQISKKAENSGDSEDSGQSSDYFRSSEFRNSFREMAALVLAHSRGDGKLPPGSEI